MGGAKIKARGKRVKKKKKKEEEWIEEEEEWEEEEGAGSAANNRRTNARDSVKGIVSRSPFVQARHIIKESPAATWIVWGFFFGVSLPFYICDCCLFAVVFARTVSFPRSLSLSSVPFIICLFSSSSRVGLSFAILHTAVIDSVVQWDWNATSYSVSLFDCSPALSYFLLFNRASFPSFFPTTLSIQGFRICIPFWFPSVNPPFISTSPSVFSFWRFSVFLFIYICVCIYTPI